MHPVEREAGRTYIPLTSCGASQGLPCAGLWDTGVNGTDGAFSGGHRQLARSRKCSMLGRSPPSHTLKIPLKKNCNEKPQEPETTCRLASEQPGGTRPGTGAGPLGALLTLTQAGLRASRDNLHGSVEQAVRVGPGFPWQTVVGVLGLQHLLGTPLTQTLCCRSCVTRAFHTLCVAALMS